MSSLSMATAGCCARVAATNIESTSIAGSANLKGILRSSRGRKKYHVRHPGPQAVEDSDSGNCCGCAAAAVDGGGAEGRPRKSSCTTSASLQVHGERYEDGAPGNG